MDRPNTFLALVATAITTTAMMFLTVLIVEKLGSAATPFVVFVCIPFDLLFLVFGLLFTYVCLSALLHIFRLMRAEEEHRFKVRYERREIDLEIHRLRLAEYRQRAKKSSVAVRRYQWKRRRVYSSRKNSDTDGA